MITNTFFVVAFFAASISGTPILKRPGSSGGEILGPLAQGGVAAAGTLGAQALENQNQQDIVNQQIAAASSVAASQATQTAQRREVFKARQDPVDTTEDEDPLQAIAGEGPFCQLQFRDIISDDVDTLRAEVQSGTPPPCNIHLQRREPKIGSGLSAIGGPVLQGVIGAAGTLGAQGLQNANQQDIANQQIQAVQQPAGQRREILDSFMD